MRLGARTLMMFGVLATLGVVGPGCRGPVEPRRGETTLVSDGTVAEYDKGTGRLRTLTVDKDRDGRPETVSFWDGTRLLRMELDTNGDGVVDRWEHYEGLPAVMVRIGASSRNDGIEDFWTYPSPDGTYVMRVETDATRDGKVDKWEEYDRPKEAGGPAILRAVGVDLGGRGRPTRWLRYHEDGRFDRADDIP